MIFVDIYDAIWWWRGWKMPNVQNTRATLHHAGQSMDFGLCLKMHQLPVLARFHLNTKFSAAEATEMCKEASYSACPVLIRASTLIECLHQHPEASNHCHMPLIAEVLLQARTTGETTDHSMIGMPQEFMHHQPTDYTNPFESLSSELYRRDGHGQSVETGHRDCTFLLSSSKIASS